MFAASKQIKAIESKLTGFSHTMYHKVEIIHSIFSAATKQKNTFSFNFLFEYWNWNNLQLLPM